VVDLNKKITINETNVEIPVVIRLTINKIMKPNPAQLPGSPMATTYPTKEKRIPIPSNPMFGNKAKII
jgi:hypothetical protein